VDFRSLNLGSLEGIFFTMQIVIPSSVMKKVFEVGQVQLDVCNRQIKFMEYFRCFWGHDLIAFIIDHKVRHQVW
jgi:hypothetical protein